MLKDVCGLSKTACLFAVSVMMLSVSAPAFAQQIPPPTIAILDHQRILRESAAAIDIKAQIERQRKVYQDAITKQEQELRATDQELTRQRTLLAPDIFAQKRRDFEGRVAEVQRQVQARKHELDQAYDYGIKQVQHELTTIIVDLAKERGFNVVLPRQQIVFADRALNITDDVLARLNERLSKVAVPLTQN